MNRAKQVAKRGLSWLLTLAMLLSMVGVTAFAADAPATVSKGELVVGKYGGALSDGEKAIAEKLIPGEFTYSAPGGLNEDGLITINAEAKTFEAGVYQDTGEATHAVEWQPVKAVLRVEGEADVDLDLATGVIPVAEGVPYSVVVTYCRTEDLAAEATELAAAMRAPAELANGLEALRLLNKDILPSLRTLTDKLDVLYAIVSEDGYTADDVSFAVKINDTELKKRVEDLTAQTGTYDDATGDFTPSPETNGRLKLVALLEDGGVNQANLLEHGDEIAKEAAELLVIFDRILDTYGWTSLVNDTTLNGNSAGSAIDTANDVLTAMRTNLTNILGSWEAGSADAWTRETRTENYRYKTGRIWTDYSVDVEYVTSAKVLDDEVKALVLNSGLNLTADAQALGGGHAIPALTANDIAADSALTVAERDVIASVGQHTVTFKLSADVVVLEGGANVTKNTDDIESAKVDPTDYTFVEGMAKADVIAGLEAAGKEDTAKTFWAANTGFLFDETKYDRTVIVDLPDTLTANAVYEIKFVPKYFTYEYTGADPEAAVRVPYGTTIILPAHPDSAKSYDYVIDGVDYREGDPVLILENTVIERSVGDAYQSIELDDLALMAVNNGLNDESKTVLDNDAIKTDTVSLRVPNDDSDLVTVTFDGTAYTIKGKTNYDSRLSGNWLPLRAIATLTGGAQLTVEFNGRDTVIIDRTDVEQVQVVYGLEIPDAVVGDKIEETVNLPVTLKAEKAAQELALKNLTDIMDDLALFEGKKDEVDTAITTYGDTRFGPGIKEKFELLMASCIAANGNLLLYTSMTGYQDQGIAYYYNDPTVIDTQLALLHLYMSDIASDPGVRDVITEKAGASYLTRMDNIVRAVEAAKAGLDANPINGAITVGNSSIGDLVTALESAGIAEANPVPATLQLEVKLNGRVPGRNTIKVTVEVKNVEGNTTASRTETFSYPESSAIDNRPADFIPAAVNELLGADADLYDQTQDQALPTGAITEDHVITVTLNPKWFNVNFVDEGNNVVGTARVAIGSQRVELPVSQTSDIRYDYYVNGTLLTDTSYTFSKDQLRAGGLSILRIEIIESQEKLVKLVDKLNKAQKDNGMVTSVGGDSTPVGTFLLYTDPNGQQVLVLRITPSGSVKKTEVYGTIARNIVTSGLYIGISGPGISDEKFLQQSKIYPQSAIDMVLNSGFGMRQLLEGTSEHLPAFDKNGHINRMTLPGEINRALNFNYYEPTVKGGYLMGEEFTLRIGTTPDNAKDVKFYVTMEDFGVRTSDLKTLRSNLNKLYPHFDVSAVDGAAKLTVKSVDAYKVYLGAAVASGYADVHDLYSMDHQAYIEFLFGFVDKLLDDEDITLDTYTNTAGEIGVTINLHRYNNYYEYFRKGAKELIGHSEPDGKSANQPVYTWNFTYDTTRAINKLLEKAGLENDPDLQNAVPEKVVKYAVAVELPDDEYVAVVIDPQANGKRNKVALPADAAALQRAINADRNDILVIMLKDIPNDSLLLNKNIVLDLNGKQIAGLTDTGAGRNVVIVDSTLNNAGRVGTVSGTGALKITGGTYDCDISAFLPDDYIQLPGGKVANKFYELDLDPAGNILVELNANRITLYGIPSAKALAVEIAFDLAMNFYTAATMTVSDDEGAYNLYSAQFENIGQLLNHIRESDTQKEIARTALNSLNLDGLNGFIEVLIEDLSDFGDLAGKINPGSYDPDELLRYGFNYDTWTLELKHNTNVDELDADILPNSANPKTGNVIIALKEYDSVDVYDLNDFGSAKEEVQALLLKLAEVTTFNDIGLKLDRLPTYENKNVKLDGTGKLDVTFDLRDAPADPEDNPRYAVALAVILANGMNDPSDVVDAIEKFYEEKDKNHIYLRDLKTAMEAAKNSEALKGFEMLERGDGEDVFEQMVDNLGLTGTVDQETIDLARTYRAFLVALGTAVAKSGFDGGSRTFGSMQVSDDETSDDWGVYSIEKNPTIERARTQSYRFSGRTLALTVDGTAIIETGKLTLKLFRPDPIVIVEVYDENGNLIAEFYKGNDEALVQAFNGDGANYNGIQDGYTIKVLDDVVLSDNVEVADGINLTIENGDKIDFDGKTIKLYQTSTVTVDEQVGIGKFKSFDENIYRVVEEDLGNGQWKYYLEAVEKIHVHNTSDQVVYTYYMGDREALAKAVENAENEFVIHVLAHVPTAELTLTQIASSQANPQVRENAHITIVRDNPDFTDYNFQAKIVLNLGSSVTIDEKSPETNGEFDWFEAFDPDHYKVVEEVDETDPGHVTWKYSLSALIVEVFDDGGTSLIKYYDHVEQPLLKAFNGNSEGYEGVKDGYKIVVYANVTLDEDVEIADGFKISIEGADFIDFNGKLIKLNETSEVTIDKQVGRDQFEAIPAGYIVIEIDNQGGTWTYKLAKVLVEVYDGENMLVRYTDQDAQPLLKAFNGDGTYEGVKDGYTIKVYGDVILDEDVEIADGVKISIVGGDFIDFNGKTIKLNETSEVTIDKELSTDLFVSFDPQHYEVLKTDNGNGTWTYSLVYIPQVIIKVYDETDSLIKTYVETDDDPLTAAFDFIKTGEFIQGKHKIEVLADVVLNADQKLDGELELVGTEHINFNGKSITLGADGKLIADQEIDQIVKSFDPTYYEVKKTEEGGKFIYTLELKAAKVTEGRDASADGIKIKVDNDNKLIIIDLYNMDGLYVGFITPEDLIAKLDFGVENDEDNKAEFTVGGAVASMKDSSVQVVPNGATVTVKAANPYSEDTVTYTVIELGDVNGNGFNESGDTWLIQKHLNGNALTGAALLAADINQNKGSDYPDGVDVNDMKQIHSKYVDPANYVSSLG